MPRPFTVLLIGFGDLSPLARDVAARFPAHRVAAAHALPDRAEWGDPTFIQPVYLLPGIKYEALRVKAAARSERIGVGVPLLQPEGAVHRLADILMARYQHQDVLFVGHGTAHEAGHLYGALAEALRRKSEGRFVLGVLTGQPDLVSAKRRIVENGVKHPLLVPLMINPGKHVQNKLFGKGEGSVHAQLGAMGVDAACVAEGLLDHPAVRQMFMDSLQRRLDGLGAS